MQAAKALGPWALLILEVQPEELSMRKHRPLTLQRSGTCTPSPLACHGVLGLWR